MGCIGLTGVSARRLCACGLAAAACLIAAIAWTSASASPSDGTFSVTPSSVYAGSTRDFTLEFTASVEFAGGAVQLTVPPGWPAPVNTSGSSSGDVGCAPGECQILNVTDDKITIYKFHGLKPTITVSYWATIPAVSSGTFLAAVLPNPSDQAEQFSQQVTVLPDGAFTVDPPSVYVGSTGDFALRFAANVDFNEGTIALTVPVGSDWPLPITKAPGSQGDISCVSGPCQNLNIDGNTITIRLSALTPTITIGYWATVPAVSSGIFLAAVQTNPKVQQELFHQQVTVLTYGTFSVTPSLVSAANTYDFKLKFAASLDFDDGVIKLTVPSSWPGPINASGRSSGDVSCFSGECQNLSVSTNTNTNTNTITIRLSAPLPTITVSYYATVPASSPGVSTATFSALVQPRSYAPAVPSGAQVTVTQASVSASGSTMPTTTAPTTPISTAPTTPISTAPTTSFTTAPTTPSTTVPTTGSRSPEVVPPTGGSSRSTPPGSRWLWSDKSFQVASGGVAGFAVVLLFAGWRLHRRPLPSAGASVRAVLRGERPPRVTVRATGHEPTRTVRIEPHPGAHKEPEP